MFDPFDYVLCASAILQRVDEYTLYCNYLGFQPQLGRKYHSPVRIKDLHRGDGDPSFAIFVNKYGDAEYHWKDHGTTLHGDIFDMIALMHEGETRYQSYVRVNRDFKLGFDDESMTGKPLPPKILLFPAPNKRPPITIRIKSKEYTETAIKFWLQFGVLPQSLLKYDARLVDFYYIDQYLKSPRFLTFAYKIGTEYKIYIPHAERKDKFRNSYNPSVIEGWDQLPPTGHLVIITKSMKEVMYFDSQFSIPAVAGKSENTFVGLDKILELKERFTHVVVLLDNDEPGIRASMHYQINNSLPAVMIPQSSGSKDPTDHYRDHGKETNHLLINNLLNPWIKK